MTTPSGRRRGVLRMTTNSPDQPRTGAGVDAIEEALLALVPQMIEDARIHETWTTVEAQRDLADGSGIFERNKPVDIVGDSEWHAEWAAYYRRAADTMTSAATELTALRTRLEEAESSAKWLGELGERNWALSVILAHIPDNTLAFIARKMTLEENKRFMDVILGLMSQVKGRDSTPSKEEQDHE